MSKQVKEYMNSVTKLKDYKESDLAIIVKKYEKEFEHKLDKDKVHFIRCDGRAFKTFCKGFEKPFDKIFRDTMEKTMVALCEELQGSIMGFTQSDEITIMFKKQNDDSQLPFRGRVQKICSLMASQTTLKFNEIFINEVTKAKFKLMEEYEKNTDLSFYEIQKLVNEKFVLYEKKFFKATFDCRVFSTEEENWKDVFLWRILDCQKNAIQMMARTHYSTKELLNKNLGDMRSMLLDKNIDVYEQTTRNIYGVVAIRTEQILNKGTKRECIRHKFVIKDSLDVIFYS